MFKSIFILFTLVIWIAPSISMEECESTDSPSKPLKRGILKRSRTGATDDTPPATPDGKLHPRSLDDDLDSRKKKAIDPKAKELNAQLDVLAETIFKERRPIAGEGVHAGDYYRLIIGNNQLTDSSLMTKMGHLLSLQCTIGRCDKDLFSFRMGTLRELLWNFHGDVTDYHRKKLVLRIIVLLEETLFRIESFDTIDRTSLKNLCYSIPSALMGPVEDTPKQLFTHDNLVLSGRTIMEICTALNDQLTADEKVAVTHLQKSLQKLSDPK